VILPLKLADNLAIVFLRREVVIALTALGLGRRIERRRVDRIGDAHHIQWRREGLDRRAGPRNDAGLERIWENQTRLRNGRPLVGVDLRSRCSGCEAHTGTGESKP